MAKFEEHISQAKRNLSFLQEINRNSNYDWQVTVCFYVAVHLVNAHLSKFDIQYRKHVDVNYALNPEVTISPSKVPENVYTAYIKLQNLSRRARYLCHDDPKQTDLDTAFLTYEKHLAKAIRNLDVLIHYFNELYNLSFGSYPIACQSLQANENLKIFKKK